MLNIPENIRKIRKVKLSKKQYLKQLKPPSKKQFSAISYV